MQMSEPKTPTDRDGESGTPTPEDRILAEQEIKRRQAEADMEMPIVLAIKETNADPVQTVRYKATDSFCFNCHKGVSCWNECCYDTDITLTPFDILRLARHFDARPEAIVRLFAAPAVHDKSGMPVAKLRMVDKGGLEKPCVFLDEQEGCTVYENRPAACRYYPLGLAAIKMKGHEEPEDFYFLVKEAHCKGHEEKREQTVAEFRKEQGIEPYDEQNRGWIYVLMKLASWKTLGGPWGKEPDERTKKIFYMASTDVDAFRQFVFNSSFLDRYAIDATMREELAMNDEALLALAFDWLRNVLFNEPTIALKDDVLQQSIARAQRDMGAG
jgi:Fe-S-cluster containining protein